MPSTIHKINILFYCDNGDQSWVPIDANKHGASGDHNDSAHRRGEHEFGLGVLKKLLEDYKYSGDSHNDVKIEVGVVNRNYNYDPKGYVTKALSKPNLNFITSELLEGYSQIWIFGMNYKNNHHPGDIYAYTAIQAGLTNWEKHDLQELTASELQVLADWMDAGNGVLITGDHSTDFSVSGQLNLGRALGKDIKRAGDLRIWEGPPLASGDSVVDTSHDVQGNSDNPDMLWMPLQEDSIPQNIFFDNSGYIGSRNQNPPPPHMLFQTIKRFYNAEGVIRHLPDHGHEGALKFPADYGENSNNKPVWPTKNGVQPKPEIIAWGTNYRLPKRNFMDYMTRRSVGLVTAYDGHAVGVGNIVAHSTWHHFINVNLVGFLDGTKPTPTLLHISDYFVNLAVYLDNPNSSGLPWFLGRIWYEVDLIPGPIPEEVKYGRESVGDKNPISNRWTYAHELGQFGISRLTKGINPVHLQHYFYDIINAASIEHGSGFISNYNINYTMMLGELLNAAGLQKVAEKKLQNSDFLYEGIQQAFKNHVDMMEVPLNPLKNAVVSIQHKIHSSKHKRCD